MESVVAAAMTHSPPSDLDLNLAPQHDDAGMLTVYVLLPAICRPLSTPYCP